MRDVRRSGCLVTEWLTPVGRGGNIHVFEGGDKDVAERNDLDVSIAFGTTSVAQPFIQDGPHGIIPHLALQRKFAVAPAICTTGIALRCAPCASITCLAAGLYPP